MITLLLRLLKTMASTYQTDEQHEIRERVRALMEDR